MMSVVLNWSRWRYFAVAGAARSALSGTHFTMNKLDADKCSSATSHEENIIKCNEQRKWK